MSVPGRALGDKSRDSPGHQAPRAESREARLRANGVRTDEVAPPDPESRLVEYLLDKLAALE
jgi:hypothetical protein